MILNFIRRWRSDERSIVTKRGLCLIDRARFAFKTRKVRPARVKWHQNAASSLCGRQPLARTSKDNNAI
jgi:hypothetical protein